MLGLGHQIPGHPSGKGARVGDHEHLAGALRRVDTDYPEHLQLGRRNVIVAGAHDLVYRGHALRTMGERAHGLRAADGVYLFEAEQAGHRQDVAIG